MTLDIGTSASVIAAIAAVVGMTIVVIAQRRKTGKLLVYAAPPAMPTHTILRDP